MTIHLGQLVVSGLLLLPPGPIPIYLPGVCSESSIGPKTVAISQLQMLSPFLNSYTICIFH